MRVAVVILAGVLVSAASAQDADFLIGHWDLAQGECANLALDYTPTQEIAHHKGDTDYAPYDVTTDVTYVPGGDGDIFVTGQTAGGIHYFILDDAHIKTDSLYTCVYQRS